MVVDVIENIEHLVDLFMQRLQISTCTARKANDFPAGAVSALICVIA